MNIFPFQFIPGTLGWRIAALLWLPVIIAVFIIWVILVSPFYLVRFGLRGYFPMLWSNTLVLVGAFIRGWCRK